MAEILSRLDHIKSRQRDARNRSTSGVGWMRRYADDVGFLLLELERERVEIAHQRSEIDYLTGSTNDRP